MSLVVRIFKEERKDLLLGLLIALLAFIVYANSLGNGFVYDDDPVVVSNPALNGDVLALFSGIDATDTDINPYYRPLTLITFLIEKRLHAHTAFLMHLFNVLFHAANAFLVYLLARTLISNRYSALLAGLLFAVHPINTECVDFISARNNILSGFFILTSYLVHERSVRHEKTAGAFAAAILFLAGLFSKETTLAALPFFCFLEITSLRSLDLVRRRKSFARLIPYVVCTALYLVLRNNALSSAGAKLVILPGLLTRLSENLYIIPHYLLTLICPTALSPIYTIPEDLNVLALPLFLGWLSILGILGWLLTKGLTPATLFGSAWLIIFLLPVSGIIYFPSAPMADRYLYVPAIGVWLIISDQAVRLLPVGNSTRRYYIVAVTLLLLLLAGLTFNRNFDWKNEIDLFTKVVKQYPNEAPGHAQLGHAYSHAYAKESFNDKYVYLSEQEFEKALALEPALKNVHAPLGSIRFARGDFDEALYHYTEALKNQPYDKESLLFRAMVLEKFGRNIEAASDYELFLSAPGRSLAELRPYAEARVRELSK